MLSSTHFSTTFWTLIITLNTDNKSVISEARYVDKILIIYGHIRDIFTWLKKIMDIKKLCGNTNIYTKVFYSPTDPQFNSLKNNTVIYIRTRCTVRLRKFYITRLLSTEYWSLYASNGIQTRETPVAIYQNSSIKTTLKHIKKAHIYNSV